MSKVNWFLLSLLIRKVAGCLSLLSLSKTPGFLLILLFIQLLNYYSLANLNFLVLRPLIMSIGVNMCLKLMLSSLRRSESAVPKFRSIPLAWVLASRLCRLT